MNGDFEITPEYLYAAQREYCQSRHLPVFIDCDCRCHRCQRFIFGSGGIAPEKATQIHITGCPHCNASFCD